MKLSLRGLLIGALATALSLSPFAVSSAQPDNQEIDLDGHRVQVVHAPGTDADYTNFNITFTSYGDGNCDNGQDDAIASGIEVALAGQSCEPFICDDNAVCTNFLPLPIFAFDYFINPFVAHTVNHVTYGTFFGLNPVGVGPGTVSARIVLLSKPIGGCGTWQLNVEATGLDLSSITANPISLWLDDADHTGPFCFDINDAIIGNPIIPHPVSGSRRGSRRGIRR